MSRANEQKLWLHVDGKPIDVTSYLDHVQGGAAALLQHAAKETPLEHMLCLDDYEAVAEKRLSPKAWNYYRCAADGERGYAGNLACWQNVGFRPRVLRSIGPDFDMSTTLLGHSITSPVIIAPAALAGLAHPDAEKALCRAAAQEGVTYCMSTNATLQPEDVAAVAKPHQLLCYQLYITVDRSISAKILQNVEELGFKAIVVTVDSIDGGKRLRDQRAALVAGSKSSVTDGLVAPYDSYIGWDDIAWVRQHSHLPLVLKGITTAEDVVLAVRHGVDAVWLSNHGARNIESCALFVAMHALRFTVIGSAPNPVQVLLELRKHVPHVFGACEIIVDGGIRTGGDILKAISLGARAVAVGRPFMYSLVYGQAGAAKVARTLNDEMKLTGRLLGVKSLPELTPQLVNTKKLDPLVFDDYIESV